MGGCCAVKMAAPQLGNNDKVTTQISSCRTSSNQYHFEIQGPTNFSIKHENIEEFAKTNPQKLFKTTNVVSCFKYGDENRQEVINADKRSQTTMPTQLGNSGNLAAWNMR